MPGQRNYSAPRNVGEPYRADPKDPPPFTAEGDRLPAAQPAPAQVDAGNPPLGHPPSHSPQYAQQSRPAPSEQPTFVPAQKERVQTPEERFARISLWLGVASIFAFGPILGPVAVVLGVMSIQRGEKKLGRLAIIFGLIGTLLGILFAVLVAKGVLPSLDELLDDIRRQNQK